MKKRHLILAILAGGLLAGCGNSDDPPLAQKPQPLSCEQLATLAVEASTIGLPTGGASVTSAVPVAARGADATLVPAHCLVSGSVKPVDPAAPDILFRVALPEDWNRKIVMFGGGGLNGSIPNVTGNILNAAPGALSPLQKGYAVFGSDSGHQGGGATFALNQEALDNYMGDALKKTRDVAVSIIAAHYGSPHTTSYFLGISNGGKEALLIAGRWGADWNGVVSLMPALNWNGLVLTTLNNMKTFSAAGAWLNRDKRLALRQATLDACDDLDGVQDGVIGFVQRCDETFDPATATFNGVPLRCLGGADTGNDCLSDVQIAALRIANAPLVYNFTLGSGQTSYPGWNVYTSDLGIPGTGVIADSVASFGLLGMEAPAFPVTGAMGLGASIADGWFRYAIAQDASANYLHFDPANPGIHAQRIGELAVKDAVERDLSEFERSGGKLLLAHGTEDMLISSRATEAYFQAVQTALGKHTVDGFLRFYLIPGFNHSVGATFYAGWDQLGAIEGWVERGEDPRANQVVTDIVGVPGRTRPLCIYPSWPKYNGSGDVNIAASYSCATS